MMADGLRLKLGRSWTGLCCFGVSPCGCVAWLGKWKTKKKEKITRGERKEKRIFRATAGDRHGIKDGNVRGLEKGHGTESQSEEETQRGVALNFVSRKFLCKHFCEIKKYILYFNEQNGGRRATVVAVVTFNASRAQFSRSLSRSPARLPAFPLPATAGERDN